MEISGTTAIVTGAGSGIGQATAVRLAAGGAAVSLLDVDGVGLEETSQEIRDQGGETLVQVTDVSDGPALRAAFAKTTDWKPDLRIVVNNAGIATGQPGYPQAEPDRWLKVVGVDLSAVIMGTQLAIEAMRDSGGGAIVNTASMAGLQPWPGESGVLGQQGRSRLPDARPRATSGRAGHPRQLCLPGSCRYAARSARSRGQRQRRAAEDAGHVADDPAFAGRRGYFNAG